MGGTCAVVDPTEAEPVLQYLQDQNLILQAIYNTHHHFDHINDLFDVIISSAMRGRDHDLKIYGPSGTKNIVSALLEDVYAQDIRFRIEEEKEIRKMGGKWSERPGAITKVNVQEIEPGLIAETNRWKVYADYVLHGDFSHLPDFEWRCLGYRIEAEGKVITISGDTVLCDGIIGLAKNADLLIQPDLSSFNRSDTDQVENLMKKGYEDSLKSLKTATFSKKQHWFQRVLKFINKHE